MASPVIGINPTQTTADANPLFPVLTVGLDEAGKEYVYAHAASAIDAQDAVVVDEDGELNVVSNSTTGSRFGQPCGVVNVAFADNDYGWVQRTGVTTVNVLANCGANAAINSTATDGTLDDDGTAGSETIDGIVLTTANGGSTAAAACMLNYPTVGATN